MSVVGTGLSAKAVAGADGKWTAKLPAPPVGGPYTIGIDGPQSATLNNVLVGDVWLCAGQSNMVFPLSDVRNSAKEIAAANYPGIRLTDGHGWRSCTLDNEARKNFSAVGYCFGRRLNEGLKIPIGLMQCAAGGTVAESWTGERALRSYLPELIPTLDANNRERAGEDIFAQWFDANDSGSANHAAWASPSFDDSKWERRHLPSEASEFEDILIKFAGALWFRSEFEFAETGEAMTLSFIADDADTVWVNGEFVGQWRERGQTRHYNIPARLLKVGKNTIAMRFLHAGRELIPGVTRSDVTLTSAKGGNKSLSGPWKYHRGGEATDQAPAPREITLNTPGQLFATMIVPLAPFALKGVLWYQGEANIAEAARYRKLLPTLIESWRALWGEAGLPFYIVQLPNFGERPAAAEDPVASQVCFAELREAQRLTAEQTPGCALAVTIELGNPKDIHPQHKAEVAERLALLALAKTYHQRLVCSGPAYRSMSRSADGKVALHFDLGGSTLASRDNARLTGFAIAGADKKWTWAAAKIDGDSVLVSSPAVPAPVAVRYAWAGNPDCNLINKEGLPASPFRTDDWPLVSAVH